MKKEKIILSSLAVLVGITVALLAFYFYESARKVQPSQIEKITIASPSPTPSSSIFLTVISPSDQSVVDNRILTVSGKTVPGAKIVALTQTNEVGATAASDGSFSTTITLDTDENVVEIDAIASDGEVAKAQRTVTYSTESF